MNEVDFKNWMQNNGINPKVQSDSISRLKRLEKEFSIELDECYLKDKCNFILLLFKNGGRNKDMDKLQCSLPIGKYQLSTYKYALKKYITFKNFSNNE